MGVVGGGAAWTTPLLRWTLRSFALEHESDFSIGGAETSVLLLAELDESHGGAPRQQQ